MATPTPSTAVRIGMPAASREPKVIARTISATSTPIASVALTWTWVLVKIEPPSVDARGQSRREAGWPPRGRRRSAGPPLQRDVELDLGQGVPAVLAHREGAVLLGERIGRDLDVVDLFHLRDHGVDLVVVRLHRWPSGATNRICPEVPGELGEALLEGVETLLRLGAGDGQVVLELTAQPGRESTRGRPARPPRGRGRAGPGATTACPSRYSDEDMWIRYRIEYRTVLRRTGVTSMTGTSAADISGDPAASAPG